VLLAGWRLVDPRSRAPWCPEFPPVDRWALTQLAGGELTVADVAEPPEPVRSTGLLGQHLVDIECVQFAAAEPIAA
jgi:hypothetical protein